MEGVSDFNGPPYPYDDCSPRPDRNSDADVGNLSPASSNYSSCDGSDFDRYCSANSVLGSASICSSNGNYSGIGEELHSECHILRGNFLRSGWNGYECFSDGVAEIPRANGDSSLNRMIAGCRMYNDSNECSSCFNIHGEVNTENLLLPCLANDNELPSSSSSINCFSQGASVDADAIKYDEKGMLNANFCNCSVVGIEANEDAFLSESEDSILNYEADNDCKIQFSGRSFKLVEETKRENINQVLLNSSVAFGCNDWDDFIEESAVDSVTSVSLDQPLQRKDEHTGKEFEKKMGDMAVESYKAENLTVKDVQDDNYLSEINHDPQAIDIQSRISCSKYGAVNNHEAVTVDQIAKDSEYIGALGLQNTLYENNDVNLNPVLGGVERRIQSSHEDDKAAQGIDESSEETLKGESEISVSTISSSRYSVLSYCTLNGVREEIRKHELDKFSCSLPLINTGDGSVIQMDQGKDPSSPHLAKEDVQEGEIRKVDTYDSYDEMVLEMEEILLDSRKCHGSMLMQVNQGCMSKQSRNFGDSSSIASTSATDDIYSPIQVAPKIDRVEVIGAKQKKGDVSFGERLVGVQEYTVYQMNVWSGTDVWKVERRYRDFFTLYCQLKALFNSYGLSLPSAWSSVEQESRKVFGNASPNVVTERSILIEDCLLSIVNSTFHFGTPRPLTLFLTPGKIMFKSGLLWSLVPQFLQKFTEDEKLDCPKEHPEDASLLGKTISLVIDIKPRKSLRQLLEIQHYACAGCHRRLDAGKTLFREFVQTFGWSRPRFCEYTGQLFCASCHTNDSSVLPARVLHHWDFTKYPVSQLAKAYLESIYDQPMLCVSAVNPFLFSKVPALLQVMGFRKKIGAKYPYVNCPFRSSIQRNLGFRRYLLESNDFFALRDLVDLSKGPFAALPVMLENISDLILEHITQQCLVCYDSGVACAARQACHNPSSLIFPFQESEAEKCTSCGSIFHKACYLDLHECPCSNSTTINKRISPRETRMKESHRRPVGFVESSIQSLVSNSATGFFTNILTKAKSDIWKTKNSSPVILMGSLPSSST